MAHLNRFILALIFTMGACAGPAEASSKEKRIPITFQALEFNSVASQYLKRPTWVELDSDYLFIYIDNIGKKGKFFTSQEASISHVKLIDKFLKWEAIAVESGDLLDKDIGTSESAGSIKYKYMFHSGNTKQHYLILEKCLWGCNGSRFYFDRDGAQGLRALLESYSMGTLKKEDTSSKYN